MNCNNQNMNCNNQDMNNCTQSMICYILDMNCSFQNTIMAGHSENIAV